VIRHALLNERDCFWRQGRHHAPPYAASVM
jgi:hypothetical protein